MKSISLVLFGLFTVLYINGLPFNVKSNDGSDCLYLLSEDPCMKWYDQQGNPEALLNQTAKPPCQIPTPFPSSFSADNVNWTTDETCNPQQVIGKCTFHQGAYGCYRSCKSSTGPGGQACYYKNGTFIGYPQPGAGSVDAEAICDNSATQDLKHFCADVLPYIICCGLATTRSTENCNKYNQARPTGTCQGTPAF